MKMEYDIQYLKMICGPIINYNLLYAFLIVLVLIILTLIICLPIYAHITKEKTNDVEQLVDEINKEIYDIEQNEKEKGNLYDVRIDINKVNKKVSIRKNIEHKDTSENSQRGKGL